MTKKVSHTTHGKFPGTKLEGADKYKKLYHYTSFESFVKIWLSERILFSNFQYVNDLFESNKIFSNVLGHKEGLLLKIRKRLNSYKQISFTMDYDSYRRGAMSTLMWGHYGQKGAGVCIEIDYNKLQLSKEILSGEVHYKDSLPYANAIPNDLDELEIDDYFINNSKEIFFQKLIDWEGENEFRMISYKSDFLNIKDAITAIYITDIKSVTYSLLKKLLDKSDIPIKLVQWGGVGEFDTRKRILVVKDAEYIKKVLERAESSTDNFARVFKQ